MTARVTKVHLEALETRTVALRASQMYLEVVTSVPVAANNPQPQTMIVITN